LVDGVGRIL